jgi:L-seryl-tRNA(Ser) seleniumtransferase
VGDSAAQAALRKLPAVGALLASPEVAPLIARFGRALVTDAARKTVETTRSRILATGSVLSITATDIEATALLMTQSSLRRVINGTGVVLHTNLGRAPLAKAAQQAILDVAKSYCTVEFDVAAGERGDRHRHIAPLVTQILGTEGALVFNNNAGAVLVMLAALCRGKEVIVARGELVEIGGGFRVPDVMKESGAILVEVGTTNKVYAKDYAAAITEKTAAILRVHRSNFAIVGFVAEPDLVELVQLAKERNLPLLHDLGSGLLASEAELGPSWPLVRDEPRVMQVVREGADIIAFSGDKLLGGPQAGIVTGKAALIEKIKKHPLARAIRADKLTLAALEATLRLYRDGKVSEIPAIRDISAPEALLEARAQRIQESIRAKTDVAVDVMKSDALAGGGSLPLAKLPTSVVVVGRAGEEARLLAGALREQEPPLITRVVEDRCAIDVRTIQEDEIEMIAPLVERALARTKVVLKENR